LKSIIPQVFNKNLKKIKIKPDIETMMHQKCGLTNNNNEK